MKTEVRCPQCGKGYLLDPASVPPGGGFVPCVACGASIVIEGPKNAPAPPAPPTPAPAPKGAPAAPGEVVCPRCGLHFVPAAGVLREPNRRATVLLVEDMPYFVEIAKDALGGRYDLRVASSVDDGLRELAKGGVDVLLLDVTLEDGEDGLRLLRSLPDKPCPILLFTAKDESEMYGDAWERLQALGVDDVVFKGLQVGETLARKVAKVLGETGSAGAARR